MALFKRVWPSASIPSPRDHSWVIAKPYRNIDSADGKNTGATCSDFPLASAPRSIPDVTNEPF
jgi:hypothetical protein